MVKRPSLHIPMSTKLGGMQAVQYLLLHSSLKLDFPFQTFESLPLLLRMRQNIFLPTHKGTPKKYNSAFIRTAAAAK